MWFRTGGIPICIRSGAKGVFDVYPRDLGTRVPPWDAIVLFASGISIVGSRVGNCSCIRGEFACVVRGEGKEIRGLLVSGEMDSRVGNTPVDELAFWRRLGSTP